MRFEETWNAWKKGRLTQEEAGRILGMSERPFRRYIRRVEEEKGMEILETISGELNNLLLDATHGKEEGLAFLPWTGESLEEILCEHFERIVGNDNCVSFEGRILQIPSDRY